MCSVVDKYRKKLTVSEQNTTYKKRELTENIHEVTIEIFAEDVENKCIRVGRAYPDSVIDYKRMEKDIESLLALYIRNVIDYFDGKVVETRTFNISEIKG